MDKEISNSMIYQDERIIKLIQLLQRARDREVLNDETARKLDEIEERVRNCQPVPEEEIELFFVAATDSNEFNERFDILRDEYHAYYAEQKSIQYHKVKNEAIYLVWRMNYQDKWKSLSNQEIQRKWKLFKKEWKYCNNEKMNYKNHKIQKDNHKYLKKKGIQFMDNLNNLNNMKKIYKKKQMIIQLVMYQSFGIDDIIKKVEDVKESDYCQTFLKMS